jgi:endonuclease YncB( thermonuclease family)
MRRKFSLMLFAVVAISLSSAPSFASEKRFKGKIDRAVDGDSFHAIVDGKKTEIRLIGADTPEAYGPKGENQKEHATRASNFTYSLIKKDTEFEVAFNGNSTHGRPLAWLYVDGIELGHELVAKGYAVPYMYCDDVICADHRTEKEVKDDKASGTYKPFEDFAKSADAEGHIKACQEARKKKLEIWDDANPKLAKLEQIPQEYRRVTKENGAGTKYFIGDYYKKTYVKNGLLDYSEDVIGIDYCDRVLFDDEEHAKMAGFTLVENKNVSSIPPVTKNRSSTTAKAPPKTTLKPFTKHEGKLIHYGDGDTFTVKVEKETFDVRLIGADTPETVGKPGENQYEHGKAAADFIKSELTAATQFEVELNGGSSYDRLLGWVHLNGQELSLTLVEKGYAHPYLYCDDKVACAKKGDYKKFLKTNRVAESLAACEQARKDKLGIWADTSKLSHLDEVPMEYRRRTMDRGAKKARYVIASVSKNVYVPLGLDDYTEETTGIDYCDRVIFLTEKTAKDAGFKPATAPVK